MMSDNDRTLSDRRPHFLVSPFGPVLRITGFTDRRISSGGKQRTSRIRGFDIDFKGGDRAATIHSNLQVIKPDHGVLGNRGEYILSQNPEQIRLAAAVRS